LATVDDATTPTWEQRFRAPNVQMPDWSPRAPDRLVYESTESGVWQVHCWDRVTGVHRQVTDHPVGAIDGTPTLDGNGVIFWRDATGDESGAWFVQPFAGGETQALLDGVPIGWNQRLAQAPGAIAAAISDRDGFGIWVSIDDGPAKELARSTESLFVAGGESGGFNRGGLSTDGSLLCLEHSEHGDLIHPALRVVDPRTGAVAGELLDRGSALKAACWSPIEGDPKLVIIHELEGEERAAIWDLGTGRRTDLDVGLGSVVEVQDWWPDAGALLVVNLVEGRHHLYRFDLATGTSTRLEHDQGTISTAKVRPDGSVWYRLSQGSRQARVLEVGAGEVLRAEGERAPRGRRYESWRFDNGLGDNVHGFSVTPPGNGPFPVIMLVHGGPTWLDTDRWSPEVQAYVEAGFAVGMVNYRGSIGYGREWRDILIGNIGKPELEDVNAGLADLVSRGIADPARAVIAGWSWGGYTTLMELGKHPELWVCGVAGVPVGDYELSYDDMSPELQAYDRALLGGAPADVPELMADRNPIHFADDVRVPVLFIIGEHDSRCPPRQAMAYVDRLAARDHPHEVYLFGTGHSSFDVDETVRQQRAILDFLARTVPAPEGASPDER
jgi:pimeloyl-ACP methyl ester carboxylesterase